MSTLRLFFKWLVRRAGFGARLIEYCHDCGREQPVIWWAPDWLYAAVDDGRNAIYCPECFDKRAYQKFRVLIRWRPEVHEATPFELGSEP